MQCRLRMTSISRGCLRWPAICSWSTHSPIRSAFASIISAKSLIGRLGGNVTGKFADEVELHNPFDFLIAQASATVEGRAPTWYSNRRTGAGERRTTGYARILLPTWGDGRIELLLGAIA